MAATQSISFPFQIQYSMELCTILKYPTLGLEYPLIPLPASILSQLSFILVGLLHSDLNYPLCPQVQSSQLPFHLLRQPHLELGSETHAYRRLAGSQSKWNGQKISRKGKSTETESWPVVAYIWGWEKELTTRGHKGTFWCDRSVRKLDCGDDCTILYILYHWFECLQ